LFLFPFTAFPLIHTHTLRVLQQTSHYDLLQQEDIQHYMTTATRPAFQRRSPKESMFNDSMNTKSERDTPIQQGFDDSYIWRF
jgi:hypothetical protein